MSDELWKKSATEMSRGMSNGEFTSVQVVESVLARVAEYNSRFNAITYDLSAQALETAAVADRVIRDGKKPVGALHGVPVTVKENVDQAGTPNTNGLPALADFMATEDSPVVANLRRAGAIIIGRTNTPELSMRGTTDNPLRGRTVNPWDDEASPGGSSGGAGVAAAVGFGPVHHGNDIGGSLRFPSTACGVSTIKPTQGRVPAYNPSATAERGLLAQLMSVQGAICRQVCDVRLATGVMAAADARDPWWVPAPFDSWPAEPLPPVVFTRQSHGYDIHPDVEEALLRTVDALRDAGYEVTELDPPPVMEAAQGWFDVATYELEQTLGPMAKQHGTRTIQNIFDWYCSLGNMVDAEGYRIGVAERTRMTREWNVFLDQHPLVLTPLLMRPMYTWNYDAQSWENTRDLFLSSIYSCGINYLGLPAGVFPAGKAQGLPCGVQLIGRRFREDQILDAMQAIEDRFGVMTDELWEQLG